MHDNHDPSPFNQIPPVVLAIAFLLVAIEARFLAGEAGIFGGQAGGTWRLQAIEDYAFYGQIFDFMIQRGDFRPEFLMRFVSYAFVHGAFMQMLFVGVFLLAMGKFTAEVFRPTAVVVVFVGSAIGGALAYGLIVNDPRPLVGGFPAVYGLIGSYTYILWVVAGNVGASQLGAFRLIAMLLGIQLVFAAIFGSGNDWVADIGGFASGFLLSFLVSPGGWARLRSMMRDRQG